eukprot:PhF_6_TR25588/c1_g1_i5/m.35880
MIPRGQMKVYTVRTHAKATEHAEDYRKSRVRTYKYLPVEMWPVFQQEVLRRIRNYDPVGGGTAENGEVLKQFFSLPKQRLGLIRCGKAKMGKLMELQLKGSVVPSREAVKKQLEEDEAVVRRATAIMRENRPNAASRANRVLTEEKYEARAPEEIRAELGRLHPQGGPVDPFGVETAQLSFDPETVRSMIKNQKSGAAPGPSGWTEELLEAACAGDEVATVVGYMLRDIVNNRVHPDARELVVTCRLVAVPRANRRVRPITVPEVLLKLAANGALGAVADHLKDIFGNTQRGFRMPHGCDSVVFKLLDAVARGDACANLDMTNAYQCVDRAFLRQALTQYPQLKALYPLFDLCYSKPSDLIYFDKDGTHVVRSTRGTRQGDVLGLVLFCIALMICLNQTKKAYPDVQIEAIVDDVSIHHADVGRVAGACNLLKQLLADAGLEVNNKSTLLLPDGDGEHPELREIPWITVSKGSAKVLGALISNSRDDRKRFLQQVLGSYDTLLRRLGKVHPQIALVLLQQCIAHKMNYDLYGKAAEDRGERLVVRLRT